MRRITHFVVGLGACGTMIGCGHYFREAIPEIKLVGLIPQEHHRLGILSKEGLGATRFLKKAKNYVIKEWKLATRMLITPC